MTSLLLPKGYLSYSALTCFKTSKKRFAVEYFENGDRLNTAELRYGKFIAKLIEKNEHKTMLPSLTVYDVHEYEIKVKIDGVPLLSYIDNCKPDFTSFRDDKTGVKPWNNVRVQKLNQLLFYAVAIRAKHGKAPKDAYIDWIETVKFTPTGLHHGDNIRATGRVESFRRVFDERELDIYQADIIKTAHQISDYYKEWIGDI